MSFFFVFYQADSEAIEAICNRLDSFNLLHRMKQTMLVWSFYQRLLRLNNLHTYHVNQIKRKQKIPCTQSMYRTFLATKTNTNKGVAVIFLFVYYINSVQIQWRNNSDVKGCVIYTRKVVYVYFILIHNNNKRVGC